MKLFYHPLSPNCHKVLLALNEKGAEFEREVVQLFDPEVKAAFTRDHNPLGKIPFARLDDGYPIPESSTIIEYIDTHFEGPTLIPEDKDQARRSRFFDRIWDLYVLEMAGKTYFENKRPEADRRQDQVDEWQSKIQLSLKFIEATLEDSQFVVGNAFGLADITVSVGLNMLQNMMGYELADWPHSKAWLDRVRQRPSWQALNEEYKPALAAMQAG